MWIPKVYDGHNRSFFFFNFEQFRENVGLSAPVTVPTAAYRIGDFTKALSGRTVTVNGKAYAEGQIFDPLSGPAGANGNARLPFVGNTITKDRFDPVALAIATPTMRMGLTTRHENGSAPRYSAIVAGVAPRPTVIVPPKARR